MNNFINFEIQFNTGIIHLNRPNALNALNLEMAESFLYKLLFSQLSLFFLFLSNIIFSLKTMNYSTLTIEAKQIFNSKKA